MKGFTLIEILIALLISTIIAVLTFSGLQSLIHIRQQLNIKNQQLSNLQTTFWHFQQDIFQFQPAHFLDSQNDSLPSLSVQNNRLSIITAQTPKFNLPFANSGLIRVDYEVRDNTLYRISYPIQNQAFTSTQFKQPLLKHVKKIALLALDNNNQWHSSYALPGSINNIASATNLKAIDVIIYFSHGQIHRIFPLFNPLITGGSHV